MLFEMCSVQIVIAAIVLVLFATASGSPTSESHERRKPTGGDALQLGRQYRGPPSFKLQQVRNDAYHTVTGLEAMVQAYSKYKRALTPELRWAVDNNQVFGNKKRKRMFWPMFEVSVDLDLTKRRFCAGGSVRGTAPAYSPLSMDYEYVCPVQIGTPPQTLYMNLDTGSADLYVAASPSITRCASHISLFTLT